jgi:two-component system LytT family response regulator
MSFYENTLDVAQFVRVHRSYIIQLNQLTKIEPTTKDSFDAVLKSGAKIPLSKSGYSKLKEALGI